MRCGGGGGGGVEGGRGGTQGGVVGLGDSKNMTSASGIVVQ